MLAFVLLNFLKSFRMRVFIDLRGQPLRYRYLDSVHAALIAGLVDAGAEPKILIGEKAGAWCFAAKGYSKRKGDCMLTGVTISAASAAVCTALERLDPRTVRVASDNGDKLDFSRGIPRLVPNCLSASTDRAMFLFASPFILPLQKTAVGKTWFINHLDKVDIDMALRKGLERRARKSLDITFFIDRLSLRVDGTPRIVRYRRMKNGRDMMVNAFSLPVSVRGTPEAIRFAYFAGLGAKTRTGFGCPILPR